MIKILEIDNETVTYNIYSPWKLNIIMWTYLAYLLHSLKTLSLQPKNEVNGEFDQDLWEFVSIRLFVYLLRWLWLN